MIAGLPLLPTMGVGSYAVPGWFIASQRQAREGRFGPHDVEEAVEDAVRVIVADQLDAGIDILSDGEVRRQRFVYEMYQHLTGLERVDAPRRLGIAGYDQAPHFRAVDVIRAPNGLGLVEEYRFLRALAGGRPVKLALPGPLTFAMSIEAGARGAEAVLGEITEIVADELRVLDLEGAPWLQLDEPSLPHPPFGLSLTEAADVTNLAFAAFSGYRAVHVCFGNNAGRPFADRRFGRLMEAVQSFTADQLVLEFANREMAEVHLLEHLAERFEIAAGVVDVKNYYVESTDDIARRVEQVLLHVPEQRLAVTADCGFSALPRYIAKQKLTAMVEGTKQVRGRL